MNFKKKKLALFVLGFFFVVLFPSLGEVERKPVKYELQLIYLYPEEQKTEFIFLIGQTGFKSVASLKRFLETLPPGSELRWAPGCESLGGEPLLSSEKEMKDFRDFLAARNIQFILVPSG